MAAMMAAAAAAAVAMVDVVPTSDFRLPTSDFRLTRGRCWCYSLDCAGRAPGQSRSLGIYGERRTMGWR